MFLILKRLLFVLGVLLPLLVSASQSNDFNPRLREGIRLYKADLLNDAKRVFRDLSKDYPDSLTVLRYLGAIYTQQEEWGDAKDWYDKIIDLKQDDLEAHYNLGICYRETGKYKAFVLKGRDFNRAERHFKFVLETIGSYKDLYYQYALLKKYWEDYSAAVDLSEKQLAFYPDTKDVVGVYRFYESFLFNKPKEFHEWALTRSGDRNSLYLGESYRCREEIGKADSILQQLAKTALDVCRVPLYLALAKVKYQQGQEDSCQYFYEQAIEVIQNDVDAALMFQDVKYILSDQEWFEYQELKQADAKRTFFKKLWISRNPMPASQKNYRAVEHIRRVIVAENEYYFDGIRSQVNNPDKLHFLSFPQVFELNDKFNDKGLVYIRHGIPDDRAFSIQGSTALNETWVYYPRGQLNTKLIFHFWQDSDMAGNNWRFIPSIPQSMAESRLNMDPIFGRLYVANYLEALAIDHEMKQQSQELVKVGMDTDQHSWKRDLRSIFFPFYLSTFRESSNTSRCELYYSLTGKDVLPEKMQHTNQDSVAINFAVFDLAYNTIEQVDLNIRIQEILDSTKTLGFWPSQFNFTSMAGSYYLALDIRTPNDEAIGGYKFRFNISDYADENLKMSGIVLAKSIRATQKQDLFYKNGFTVVPNPGKVFTRKKPVNVYFEIYNVLQDANKRQNFVIRYTVRLLDERTRGIVQKIGRIFRNPQPSISNDVEREADKPTSVEYIALDLGKNVPGIYELSILAFVPGKEDTVSRKINFELQ